MRASLRLALGVGCIAAAVFASASAQSVYSWKDDKGVTHYSDSPPPKGAKSREVPVSTAQPTVSRAPVTTPTPASTAKGAAAEDPVAAERRAAVCKQAQYNLDVLKKDYAVVSVDRDGDGKDDAVLTPEERTAQTAQMTAAVQSNCPPPGAP
ncbi:DUF4124 domain-containing protein [Lysobacter sp. KIS68-7]|uniref:DUF4124 domain-containing protein n=1 Tax=Lysobacter sp. KIS68-7 TaxID=2904252 RepID=UPI001E3A0E84|nr:DUF4124 domain-containing protein [Lysobacter sp. KIS68-7]UHQ19987.1 DUF4124 domain-containing protein [Lysobacter sp. KIS68-7]